MDVFSLVIRGKAKSLAILVLRHDLIVIYVSTQIDCWCAPAVLSTNPRRRVFISVIIILYLTMIIIPLTLVGYELIITKSPLNWLLVSSHIIVKYKI